MEEGGRGAQGGPGGPRRLYLDSRHRGVRGDLARARRPCARRVLRRGGPEVAEEASTRGACARRFSTAWRMVPVVPPRALAACGCSCGDAGFCCERCVARAGRRGSARTQDQPHFR